MKKALIFLLVCCMGISMLTGCKKEETTEPESVSDSAVEMTGDVEVVVEDQHEGEARSYLTGEWIDEELAAQRPVAIMMGNTTAALPQCGISNADIVYEAPVEGALTRLMAVFQDYENIDKIMSVRSCRHYYVHWALEYDAIYIHYGQAKYAKDILSQSYVHNLNAMEGSVNNAMFHRDSSKSEPHNAYTVGEEIIAGIELKEYSKTHAEDYTGHFIFNEDDENEIQLTNGTDVDVVNLNCYSINKPWFEYNEEDGLYYRYQYGSTQVDGIDNSALSCKNIILQVSEWSVIDSKYGYLNVETTGSGNGYYVTNGKMIPITWKKDSVTEPTHYYAEDGTEITLNQGKTWVCVVQDTYEDRVTFQAAEDEAE